MLISSEEAIIVFEESIYQWHLKQQLAENTQGEGTIKFLLFEKNQIDTIQWHKEDEIRRTDLDISEFVDLKRSIDRLNQQRTDLVEKIDDFFFEHFSGYPLHETCRLNSETPAWMLDRMSILELKIWHMREQTERLDVSEEHVAETGTKLNVLLEQRTDLSQCLDELLEERRKGRAYFKVYRQMKMYNDRNLNPSLYGTAHKDQTSVSKGHR